MRKKRKFIINKDIILEDDQEFAELILLSDVHYGNKDCDVDFFEKVIDWIYRGKHRYIITGGDLLECRLKDSVGLPEDQTIPVNEQVDYIVEKLKPIADEGRLIGMIRGNHEKRISRSTGIDITEKIARLLGVPYAYRGSFFQIRVKQKSQKRGQIYTLYGTHGASGSWTSGGKINAVERMIKGIEAEIIFMGHVHDLLHKTIPRMKVDRGRVKEIKTHFIVTGSYLKYLGSYGQEKGYPPTSQGSPKVKLHTDKHRISVSMS
jgi:hypothetical protein